MLMPNFPSESASENLFTDSVFPCLRVRLYLSNLPSLQEDVS